MRFITEVAENSFWTFRFNDMVQVGIFIAPSLEAWMLLVFLLRWCTHRRRRLKKLAQLFDAWRRWASLRRIIRSSATSAKFMSLLVNYLFLLLEEEVVLIKLPFVYLKIPETCILEFCKLNIMLSAFGTFSPIYVENHCWISKQLLWIVNVLTLHKVYCSENPVDV